MKKTNALFNRSPWPLRAKNHTEAMMRKPYWSNYVHEVQAGGHGIPGIWLAFVNRIHFDNWTEKQKRSSNA